MAKKTKDVVRVAKLQFPAGQAKPGPALAGLGLIMPNFTREFNDATRDRGSEPVPVTITIYSDKSHSFILHTAPASYKIMQAAKIQKGSSNAKTEKVATITADQAREIAEYKIPDLNTNNVEAAMKIIAGTARQMGVLVEGMVDVKKELAAAKAAAKDAAMAEAKEAQLDADAQAAVEDKDKIIEVETTAQAQATDEEGDE